MADRIQQIIVEECANGGWAWEAFGQDCLIAEGWTPTIATCIAALTEYLSGEQEDV